MNKRLEISVEFNEEGKKKRKKKEEREGKLQILARFS